ncbi:MAG: hypothetical protein KGJ84_02295 [Elusimicrobia bacterium]|nr:hypothetical protein [Elusimicrobiota bacterium]
MIALALAAAMTMPPCPSAGETALDCPWAAAGRAAAAAPDARAALKVLMAEAPAVAAEFTKDSKDKALMALWGKSVNFDEHAKAVIIAPRILEAIGVKNHHAGLTHTYGYLFSTLMTPYGFKRARWVSGEIERGLGLPAGVFSPAPATGTLLSNLTAFAGRIAFRDDPRELARARKFGAFDVSACKVRRLTETVGRAAIRTDLVAYTHGDGYLLIYSWRDLKAKRSYLITAFPVAAGFAGTVFDPKSLGAGKTIVSRYNGDIPGVTGVAGLTGTRVAD